MMESVNEYETCILYINLKMENHILELGINKLMVGAAYPGNLLWSHSHTWGNTDLESSGGT